MKSSTRRGHAPDNRHRNELKLVLWGAAAFALGAIGTILWPVAFPDDPEKTVKVYWTHDCECAALWMADLRAAGFEVRDFELESLTGQRARLGVPKSLHGCHTAQMLSYFVEGHVSAQALQRIANERPLALGFAYARPAAAENERLYAFPPQGEAIDWGDGVTAGAAVITHGI